MDVEFPIYVVLKNFVSLEEISDPVQIGKAHYDDKLEANIAAMQDLDKQYIELSPADREVTVRDNLGMSLINTETGARLWYTVLEIY